MSKLLLNIFVLTFAASTSVLFASTLTGEVKSGQGLYQALRDVSIDNKEALSVINALSDEVEFSKLKVGDKLEAKFNTDNELVEFAFSQNPAEKHVVLKNESGQWNYEFQESKTNWHARILEGNLRPGSTLQSDLLNYGLKPSVVNEVVNILLLKVNFRMNARVGDKFQVLLNERLFQGIVIDTQVLYTSYEGVRAGAHEAFYYLDDEKNSTYTAHYTNDGQALISSGLRYPLSSLHVRSSFGMRIHPVTGSRAMHNGVDLRARSGATVHAVADGRVVESSYNEFSGNKIAIKHRDGSKSYYLHLSGRGVKVGDHVRSFQIIGSVGATGRVTGAHLHFGFKTPEGVWMNPLNKRMIATPKLQGDRFLKLREQITQTRGLKIDLELSKEARYLLAQIPNLPEKSEFSWDLINLDNIQNSLSENTLSSIE